MKHHPFSASTLSRIAVVASIAALATTMNVSAATNVDLTPVPAGTAIFLPGASRAELSTDELNQLQVEEAQVPALQEQVAGTCRTFRNEVTGEPERRCWTPLQEGVIVGLLGVLVGSLAGPVGAGAGGLIGFFTGFVLLGD